jgi:hypothetical protein
LESYVEREESAENVLDKFGRHPLHIAVTSGISIEAVELWINMFPNSTTHVDTLSNKLPLELACESKADEDVILLLLKRCSGTTFKRSLNHISAKTADKFVGGEVAASEGSEEPILCKLEIPYC